METLYNVGTEIRVVTAKGLTFSGPVEKCVGDLLIFLDRRTGKEITVNLNHIQSVENLSKVPPETDRDSPGRWP